MGKNNIGVNTRYADSTVTKTSNIHDDIDNVEY